jgi:hypothetical protein
MQAQANARPRLRQDLVAEAIEDSGARYIDVMDPDSGTVFRFYEIEYSIACAMDGDRDVSGIVRWAQEELGVTPSPAEVRSVISTLGDLGYLDTAPAAEQPAAPAAETPIARAVPIIEMDGEATSIGSLDQMQPPPAAPATVARLQLKRTPASGLPAHKQPGAKQRQAEDDLAAGVVTAPRSKETVEAGDFELGASGTGAPASAAPTVQEPAIVDEMELGASGTAATRDDAPAEMFDIPLGVSGPGDQPAQSAPASKDVSLDLSDQMAVGLADVKEAVRA